MAAPIPRPLALLGATGGVLLLLAAFQGRTAPRTLHSNPILIAEFDFDDDLGAADPQGWRPLEESAHEQAYFHVEDFASAGHEAFALEGVRSMWVGLDAEDPRTCHWTAPPGYGNSWTQYLASVEFPVQGDVTLDFLMDMDIEPWYDWVDVQYEATPGDWTTLDTYLTSSDCGDFQLGTHPCGPVFKSYTVPGSEHDGDLRFRFFFASDGAVSSEQYPAFHLSFVVDSITVTDNTGVVDYQDFESEAVDDSITVDGHWYAGIPSSSAGGLVDGASTLQESVVQNTTHFWAFIEGSTTDYGCAGHPEQPTTPTARNIVRSPRIDLTHDSNGGPIGGDVDSVLVSFDVYRDVSEETNKCYTFYARFYGSDCLITSPQTHLFFQGDQKDWYRHQIVLAAPPGADEVEIELGIYYLYPNGCVSHAPLFDNVTVERIAETATGVRGDRPALVLRQNRPNPFNPVTTIEYEVPAGAGHVTLRVYDVVGRRVRTLVDGRQPAGVSTAVWDGRNDGGEAVASGVYFYRLTAGSGHETRRMVLLK